MYKIFVNTQILGSKIIFLPKCHSTNDQAAALYEKGIIHEGDIVITNEQTAGRGQRGNKWEAKPGQNLTFSIILTPSELPVAYNFHLNIISSLAIQKAFTEYLPDTPKVKWPNDIFYGGVKLGGILIENSIQARNISRTIMGFGLNINQEKFIAEFEATSLRQILHRQFDLNEVLNKVVLQIDYYYGLLIREEFDNLKMAYLNQLYWKDEKHFFKAENIFEGYIRDIDEDGRLIIETISGKRKFSFKEVTHIQ